MSYKELLNDIKKDKLKKVYICFGKEIYLKNWAVSEIKNKYVDKSFETLNFVHLDGKETKVDDIINACETLPFMSSKKIVVVEDPLFLINSKAVSKQDEKQLVNYMNNLNDTTCLIFIVNDEKIDKRKKIFKQIKSIGAVIEFDRVKGDELNKWIAKTFKKNNKKISKNNINYFIHNSGYIDSSSDKTLYDLENEIVKICNYIGDRIEVNREDIDSILVKTLQNNIFKLVDCIGQKNTEDALSIFNEMILANEPVQLIFYMIARQFRLLLMAKLLEKKGYSVPNIAKKINTPNFVAKKVLTQSRNFSYKRLEEGLKKCLEIDENIKKGNIDSKLAIEILIVGFAK
ncbi:DNA polymerase III subunit delta [Caldisalinibacter kiritimatiensis]|uniref:DNA polymerase III subunit delta n=1 Tax=Caldisalinibacter kiritimatiensis TaxID=1304284 RepID=R1ARG9_9FIRM|nr:DNA polymerase III subunit delta [Caldisalinibacter kiritimatiensis]EOC99286.1 DNA polymerase III delta subunit [Caldisalinibacter kiritimatiensis]